MSNWAEHLENGPDVPQPASSEGIESAQEEWKTLQATSGYEHYDDYMRTQCLTDPAARRIRNFWWERRFESFKFQPAFTLDSRCSLFDVQLSKNAMPEYDSRCKGQSCGRLLSELLQPPKASILFQVLLWLVPSSHLGSFKMERRPDEEEDFDSFHTMLNLLGLCLQPQPSFFETLFRKMESPKAIDRELKKMKPRQVSIGRAVAYVTQRPGNDDSQRRPFILIACLHHTDDFKRGCWLGSDCS